MRRAAVPMLAALGVLAAPASAGRPVPTAVGVGEREFRISLYRPAVPAGEVRFNVRNFGEDAHDLAVRDASGRVLAASPEIRAGRTGTLRVKLRRPGSYAVVCTLLDHEARGMRATLRVKRAKRRQAGRRSPTQ
jgi:plastocyanin